MIEKAKAAIEDEDKTVEEAKEVFDKVHNKIRFQAFGKVTLNKRENMCIEEDDQKNGEDDEKTGTTDEDKAEELFRAEVKRAEEEVEKIKITANNKVGRVWELKRVIIGGKKGTQENTAIVNPKTNKLAVTKKEIKQVSLTYCMETLANNKPEKGFEEGIERKKELVKDLLNLEGGSFEASKNTFKEMVNKFKRSNKRNYDFLTKAGKVFQDAVFKLCQKMFAKEEFPREFQDTTLHMIFKGGIGKKEGKP